MRWLCAACCVIALATCDNRFLPVCLGDACACTNYECRCTGGKNCDLDCDENACSLSCIDGAKCRGSAETNLTVFCQDTSECRGSAGSSSSVTCNADTTCELILGDGAAVDCNTNASCKVFVGNFSAVNCTDNARCTINCLGDCELLCTGNAQCSLTCGVEGRAAAACSSTLFACGPCSAQPPPLSN